MPDEDYQQEKEREEQEETYDSTIRIPYTQENLINDHNLRNTDFKSELDLMIDKALIYESAKRALHGIVKNYFADNRFLANLNDGKTRNDVLGTSLDLEKDMIFATASFTPSDLKNPDLTNIINAILTHNRPTTSRAKGNQRERILNGKYRISQDSNQSQTISTTPLNTNMQPQPKKKGWLSFLGGN